MNAVQVFVECEDDCTIERGEFSLKISQFIGELSINDGNGSDDASLIKECCNDFLCQNKDYYQKENSFSAILILEESGEWEDVFWHKYYIVKKSEFFIH